MARAEEPPPRNDPKMLVGAPTVRTMDPSRDLETSQSADRSWMFEEVEGLCTDLELPTFPARNIEGLHQAHVGLEGVGAVHLVADAVSVAAARLGGNLLHQFMCSSRFFFGI